MISSLMLTAADSDHSWRQGWYHELGMQLPRETMTDTSDMRLCIPLNTGEEASATGVAQA